MSFFIDKTFENTEPSVTKGLSNLLDPFDFISLIIFIITAAAAVPAPGREKRGTMNKKKYAKYTDEEIARIKKWRGEGLTWGEISELNGRSADAMCVKFSQLKLGVPEYHEPEIPKVVIPGDVMSINDRAREAKQMINDFIDNPKVQYEEPEQPKTIQVGEEPKLTVSARIPKGYTVTFRAEVHFKTLDEVWDYFHTDPILLARTDCVEVTEVNEVILDKFRRDEQ